MDQGVYVAAEQECVHSNPWEKGYRRFSLLPTIQTLGLESDFLQLVQEYSQLPPDPYDKSETRHRRYGRAIYYPWSQVFEWIPEAENTNGKKYSPYFQDNHNPEHRGNYRYFETITDTIRANQALRTCILSAISQTVWEGEDARYPVSVGIHLIAQCVDIEKPTATVSPNCMHQDGEVFDYVILIKRKNVDGGESCIGPIDSVGVKVEDLQPWHVTERFTLLDPLEGFGVRDEQVAHGVSEVHLTKGERSGYRYTLLVDTTPMRERHRSA